MSKILGCRIAEAEELGGEGQVRVFLLCFLFSSAQGFQREAVSCPRPQPGLRVGYHKHSGLTGSGETASLPANRCIKQRKTRPGQTKKKVFDVWLVNMKRE